MMYYIPLWYFFLTSPISKHQQVMQVSSLAAFGPGFAFRLYYVGLEQIQPVATSPHNWGVCLVSSVPDIPGVMRFCNSWWEHTLLLAWCELHGYFIFLKRFLASELPPAGMLGAGGVPVQISTTFFLVADLIAIRCSSLLLDTLPP